MMTLAHRRNHSLLRFESEFDEHQPYFVQSMDEEEFYESPSEDIWKKFELLPTPPRSPGRDEFDDGFSPLLTDTVTSFHSSITEQLRLVSESLDEGLASPPPTMFVGDINSNLIQDCMWSGLIDTSSTNFEELEKDTTPAKTVSTKDKCNSSKKCPVTKSNKILSSTDYGTGDCVDPTAVFPYPLSDRMDLCPDTPSDSEEEIDVVGIHEKQQKKACEVRITHNYSAPYSARPSSKRKSGLNLQLHTSSSKKSKTETNIEEVKRVLQSMKTPPSSHSSSRSSSKTSSRHGSRTGSRNSSRASSDSEDIDKRASHNVLERKRRTDLKNSFMSLRDNVPELGSMDRAAKVIILRKSVDYVEELQSTADSLQAEERILRRRNAMLIERLRTLREDVLGM